MRTAASLGPRGGSTALLTAMIAVTAMVIGTAGCGSSDSSSDAGPGPSASTSIAAGAVTVRDSWVKAADTGMTAAFGTLVNDGDTDVTVVSAASSVSPVELHEMNIKDGRMVMQPKAGGIVIKARSTQVLEPGGDHLMLMDVSRPVRAGDEVSLTLTFADGRTVRFSAVAKPFTGAGESYAPDPAMSMSPGTSMSPAS